MRENQDWVEAFAEIADIITEEIPEIKFIDLWAEQTDSPEDEYPFPLPALFLEFNAVPEDLGVNLQNLITDIRMYLLYIPSDDTHQLPRRSLQEFGVLLRRIYQVFHGRGGDNFSQMSRTGLNRQKAEPYEWLYSQTFRCNILDYSATPQYIEGETAEMEISKGSKPVDQDNIYEVPQ